PCVARLPEHLFNSLRVHGGNKSFVRNAARKWRGYSATSTRCASSRVCCGACAPSVFPQGAAHKATDGPTRGPCAAGEHTSPRKMWVQTSRGIGDDGGQRGGALQGQLRRERGAHTIPQWVTLSRQGRSSTGAWRCRRRSIGISRVSSAIPART